MPTTFSLEEATNAPSNEFSIQEATETSKNEFSIEEAKIPAPTAFQLNPEVPSSESDIEKSVQNYPAIATALAKAESQPNLGSEVADIAEKTLHTVEDIPVNVYNTAARMTGKFSPITRDTSLLPQSLIDAGKSAFIETVTPNHPTAMSTGLAESGAKLVQGLATPAMIESLPLFEFQAGRVAMSAAMASQTPTQLANTYSVLADPNSTAAQKWEAGGDAFANIAMQAALVLHLGADEVKSKFTPEEAAQAAGKSLGKNVSKADLGNEVIKFNQTDLAETANKIEPLAPLTADALKTITKEKPEIPNEKINPDPANHDAQQAAQPNAAENELAGAAQVGQPHQANPEANGLGNDANKITSRTDDELSKISTPEIASPQTAEEVIPDEEENATQEKEVTQPEANATPPNPIVDQTVNNSELVGMGGAVPSEFENSPQTPTGIKNATVDSERIQRGLPAAVEPLRKSFGAVWDKAMARIDQNPEYPDQLIDELRAKPRAITDEEDATLLHRQVDLRNEYGKATRDLKQAFDDGDADRQQSEKVRVAQFSDKLLDLYNINKSVGTETGRGLNARKMMAYEDFSLAQMELSKRAANQGRPLSDAERTEIQSLHDKVSETQKAFDDYQAASEERIRQSETARVLAEAKAQANREPGFGPDVIRIAKGIVDKWDKAADDARASLKARLGRTSAGIDPTLLVDLAKIGRSYLGHAALDAAEFGAKIVSEFGDMVKPHIQEIYDASKKLIEDEAKGATDTVRKAIKRTTDLGEQIKNTTDSIKDKFSAGKNDEITSLVQKLARQFVQKGITEREPLVDAVHDVLKSIKPDLSRRDTMDAISGYGDFKQLSKDQISVRLRGIKGELQQIAKLEDLEAKQPLQKTGVERRTPTDEERRLIKQVEESKRKNGVVFTDPATQLKSALDGVKTRLTNEISDLQKQIDDRAKFVNEKTPIKLDAEAEALKAKRDELKKQFDDIFGKPEMSEEKRIELSQKALQRSIDEAEQRIKDGDVQPKGQPVNRPADPRLEPLKQKLDDLRQQISDLRDAGRDRITEKLEQQKAALEKSIAEKQVKLDADDKSTKQPAMNRPAVPELELLKQQRDGLNKQLSDLRKKPADQKAAEAMQRKLDAMNKSIADKAAQIKTGDVAVKSADQTRPMSPDLEQAKQKLEALNKQIAEIRKGPQRTPEQRALESLKTRLRKRTAELESKIAAGDYSNTPRKTTALDPEAMRLKADNERVKQKFQQGLTRDRLAQRTGAQKVQDAIVKWRRGFLLSGPVTLAKLTTAAIARAVITPLEEGVGAGIGAVFPRLAKAAPREGGFNVRAEAKALTQGLTVGAKDAWDTLTKGKSNLELTYGKDKGIPQSFIDIFGNIHGALKAPIKRTEFARSLEKRLDFYGSKGADISDPFVQMRAGIEAYQDAQRSIFMQKNMLTDAYKRALSRFDQVDKSTGQPTAVGKLTGTTARTLLPIVKVPVNIVAETMQYALGSLTGSYKLAKAYKVGIDSLKPEDADLILRQLKKGSLGAGIMLLGFLNPKMFGGYYQQGEHRDKKDVPADAARIGDTTIPSQYIHNPLVGAGQLGATIRRVADSKLKKSDTEPQGLTDGAIAGALGLADSTPFLREAADMAKLLNPAERKKYEGELAKSMLVPAAVQSIANATDKGTNGETIKRKPTTILQSIKTGIPGARQAVPKNSKQ